MTMALERMRVYQKQRRDRARAAGLCTTCCKVPHADGLVRCKRCNAMHKGYYRVSPAPLVSKTPLRGRPRIRPVKDEFCLECLAHGEHRQDCIFLQRRRAA